MVRRLMLLNGLAATLAVMHHSTGWALTAMCWWTDRYMVTTVPNYDQIGGVSFYALRLIDQVAQAPVPLFLFNSGYFVAIAAGRVQRRGGWAIARGRIKGLVPPYVLWSLATVAFFAARGEAYDVRRIGALLLTGSAAPPFYFVPLLLGLYVLSPWLTRLARRSWQLLLTGTGLLLLWAALARSAALLGADLPGADYPLLLNSHLAAHSFWFALGLTVGLHLAGFKRVLGRMKLVLLFALAAAYLGAFVEWEVIRRLSQRPWVSGGVILSDCVLSLSLLLAFLAFEDVKLPFEEVFRWVGTMAFGVYLTHVLVLEIAARVVYRLAPGFLAHQLALLAFLGLCGVGIPVLLMSLVRSSPFRRYYAYAFG